MTQFPTLDDLWTSAASVFQRAENEFNRLFYRENGLEFIKTTGSYPKITIVELPDKYTVKASVPGLTREQIQVKVTDDTVGILLEKNLPNEKSLYNEIPHSSCSRHIGFPKSIKADDIVAHLENGILTLEIPKVEPEKEPQETTIEIK